MLGIAFGWGTIMALADNVGGTATINGAIVQVLAQPGNYGKSTSYTILRATGGVSGTYSGVSSNFAFLTPSLSYDANDVFLTLSMADNAFSFGGRTFNQRAVGRVLTCDMSGAMLVVHGKNGFLAPTGIELVLLLATMLLTLALCGPGPLSVDGTMHQRRVTP